MLIRVLDLDGAVTAQQEFVKRNAATVIPMQDWGPSIRICCSNSAFQSFERECARRCGEETGDPVITFYGSGDFHHVTLALLRRLREPFNLLILDKHPDWVRGAPLLHCGTWVSHALGLPNLNRAFHVGADKDLDNGFRWVAPWGALREGRITAFPAARRLARGGWRSVPTEPLRAAPDEPASAERLERVCSEFRADLARCPLYVSIDKDVMRASDAPGNWDSGRLELAEVQNVLTWFIGAAAGRVAGVGVTGDWSEPRTQGILRGVLNRTERPAFRVDPRIAAAVNGRTNQALVDTIRRATAASIPPPVFPQRGSDSNRAG